MKTKRPRASDRCPGGWSLGTKDGIVSLTPPHMTVRDFREPIRTTPEAGNSTRRIAPQGRA